MSVSVEGVVNLMVAGKIHSADSPKVRNMVIPGTELVAVGVRGLDYMTAGETYLAIHGCEAGIFPSSPFVTVLNDKGDRYSCHLSRFVIKAHINKVTEVKNEN